jgi:FkbM family methyltransferase
MTIRRAVANAIYRACGLHIVRDEGLVRVSEQVHLRKLFALLGVDCVFDVGANEGQYAEQLRAFGYRGPIVSFEPIPSAAAVLRRRAARDDCWFIEEMALDEVAGTAAFHIMRGSQFSSLKLPNDRESRVFADENTIVESIEVATATLAEYLPKYRRQLGFTRPFLKMDTQGNDLAVARGAMDRLGEFVGLQTELAIKRLYEDQPTYREAIEYYMSRGFEISAFIPNNNGQFPSLIEIDCLMLNAGTYSVAHAPPST